MSGIGIFSPPLMITRTDDRSRCSTSGSAMIALTIAGASHTVVTRERSSSSTTAAASKARWMITVRAGRDERRGREVERTDVVQRPAGEAEVVAGEAELDEVGEVLPRQVGVGEHHALGPPGGARRVHQPVDVVGGRRRRGGTALDARSSARVVHPSRAAGEMLACTQRGSMPLVASSASSTQRLVAHERPRLGVLEDVADLRRGQPPVDRHGDGAEVVGREDRLEDTRGSCRRAAPRRRRARRRARRARRPARRPARPSRRRWWSRPRTP